MMKEKSMVKVEAKLLDGSTADYKGIVCYADEKRFILIPFDSISKNADGLHFALSDVVNVSTARFPKEVSDLLKEAYECHRKMRLLDESIKKRKKEIEQDERTLWEYRREMEEKTATLNGKRFEVLGSLQDIATKLSQDVEKEKVDCIYEPGVSMKSVHIVTVSAIGKDIHMDVRFDKEYFGETLSDLFWMDYERYYDCADWEDFKQKHCPNMKAYLTSEFPFAKVIKEDRDSGNGSEKQRVQTHTKYTLAFKASKANYSELLRMIVNGMRRFKSIYVTNSRA